MREDDAREVRLDLGNHPELVLSLSGFFLPHSGVTNCISPFSCVCVSSSVVFLAAIPSYKMLSCPFPFPLRLCTVVLTAVCWLSTFLFLYPANPLPPSAQLSGPSLPASVSKWPVPLCLGPLPWPIIVHEAPYISYSWDSLASSRIFSSNGSVTSPAVIGRPSNLRKSAVISSLAGAFATLLKTRAWHPT